MLLRYYSTCRLVGSFTITAYTNVHSTGSLAITFTYTIADRVTWPGHSHDLALYARSESWVRPDPLPSHTCPYHRSLFCCCTRKTSI